jgi:hypothetical protein
MSRVRRAGLSAALLGVAACVLAVPSAALASNHLIKIREVYAGSAAHTGDEYVELQMYASGQTFLSGVTSLKLYNATGNVTSTFNPAFDPPNGQSQRRILFATQSAQTDFSKSAGYTLAAGNHIADAGGAVCYLPSTSGFEDCVSWGSFNNTSGTPLPSATGGNVDTGGIPDGSAINRSIAAGCATMLEAGDDTNTPADWVDVAPNPLANSDTPPETPCPDTTITKAPKRKTTDRTPTFKFTSTINPATFECRLDSKPFKPCESPKTYPKLARGKHHFQVRATANGATDPTPAKSTFKIVKAQ